MSPASSVIDLEEFRKRRESRPAVAPRPMPSMGYFWVWVMVWPS